jgi:hypothetical protein
MKILLLAHNHKAKYNWGHHLYRREFGKHHEVTYYGRGYPGYDANLTVSQIVKKFGRPDFILTDGLRYTLQFEGLGEIKDIPKVHQVVDYFPPHPCGYHGSWDRQHEFFKKNKFTLLFVRQYRQLEDLENNGVKIPAFFLPFSVDIDIYRNMGVRKKYDVMATFSDTSPVYQNRRRVKGVLSGLPISLVTKKLLHQKYVSVINASRIFVTSNNVFGSPSMKYTEVLACGTFMLADRPADFKVLGFKDGEHLVLYNNMNDLVDKVKYYLAHPKERVKIERQGMNFVRENHNNTVRMNYQIDIIRKELGI